VYQRGCTNCYAMRMAARLEAMGTEKYRGLTRRSGDRAIWTGKVFCDEGSLNAPKAWSRPKHIFVNSMSDLFHPDVPLSFIGQVWAVMAETPHHTYQILTKRPERVARILEQISFGLLPNVWLGTSVEDGRVLHRVDQIRNVPAKIRFVSFEPLIGSVHGGDLADIHWAIVGGESGPKARLMDSVWVDEIAQMCAESGTTFFFKQWGGKNKKTAGRLYRDRTWDDFPTLSA
jgi:protein gp37